VKRLTGFRFAAVVSSTLVALLLAAGGVFVILKTAEVTDVPVPRVISQSAVVQEVFGESAFEVLMRRVSEERFATVWDFDEQILMSRAAFLPTEMFGQPKFRYRPDTQVANLHLWTGVSKQRLIVGMTPEIEELLEPLAKDVIHRADFQTDRHGFKTTEFEPRAGATVFFLGDSFTEGIWVSPKETFVNVFGRHLKRDESPLTPVNLGVNGFSALEMRWMLERFAPTLRPRAAIFNLYPNDVGADLTDALTRPESLETEFAAMFDHLRQSKGLCQRQGIQMILALVPAKPQILPEFRRDHPVFDAFQRRVKAWAAEEDILCFDALEHLHQVGTGQVYLDWDGHFSPQGHRHYADFLYGKTRATLAALAEDPVQASP